MDCRTFHQHANAHADGELEGDVRADATEHVASCPKCATFVDSIADMKSAVARVYSETSVPPTLKAGVLAALDGAPGNAIVRPRFGRAQAMIPLGIAAAVAVAALWWWPVGGQQPRRRGATSVPGQTVADVRQQHTVCVGHGGKHRAPDLPRDPGEIVNLLSDEFGLTVIVPDFSASGFELLGVGRCGIRSRRGVHALYRGSDQGVNLSVFTVKRMDCLPVERLSANSAREYFFEGGEPLSVLAWHSGQQTYVVCAPLAQPALLAIVERIRSAGAPAPTDWLALGTTERRWTPVRSTANHVRRWFGAAKATEKIRPPRLALSFCGVDW